MEDRDQLKKDAYECLDKNNFSKAIEIYHKLILLKDFSKETLINLSVCEDQERLRFAREVGKLDGWNSKLYEAQIAFEIRCYAHAIAICNEVLSSFKLETKDAIRVHIIRLKASCLCGDNKFLIEDFMTIWKSGNIIKPFKKLRKEVLEFIAAIKDPCMLSALLTLTRENRLSGEIVEFISDKVNELKSLEKSIKSTRD